MSFTNLINKNAKAEYFYRVSEFLMVFGKEKKSFSTTKDFKGDNLPKLRIEAEEYLAERQKGIEERGHFYDAKLVPPDTKISMEAEHSAYSIHLILVVDSANEEEENILYGEDAETIEESESVEKLIYQELGFEPLPH
ncbi:MAG: hypothetical protein DA407_17080 [Bacteroidetes bacterium]|nr:MAG: hypothetical protein DA407_17080 [Bacteroidota bacterium]